MKRQVNIHIGEYHASREPVVIHTVLGSCVAVCLHDPENLIGGMNHILLPGKANLARFDNAARYGINAMELLINRIMALGGRRSSLVAKVFGGAHILTTFSMEDAVGHKNAEFAFEFLEMEGIPIISHDLEGQDSRRIYYHTDTNEVFLKRVPPIHCAAILTEEQEFMRRVKKAADKPAKITLFKS